MSRRLAFCFGLAAAVATAPATARAGDDCLVEVGGVGLGFVIPDRGCKGTVLTDVQLAAATTNWSDFAMRGTAEVGGMWAIPDHQPAHFGAVVAVSGTTANEDDPSSRASADVAALMRARYWLPPFDPGMSMVLDAAAGPAVLIPTGQPFRYGGYFELGASLHGMLGVFVAAQPTVSSQDQTISTRYAIGAKTTAVGFLIVLSIYACSQTSCV